MVVDEVDDLDFALALEVDVGDIGLPHLVGQIGHEAHVGGPGPLMGLGGDKAPRPQHPPDGRDAGHSGVALGEVEVDGRRPGVEPGVDQLLSDGDDLVLVEVVDPGGRDLGTPRTRRQPRLALLVVTGQQFVDPAAVDPVSLRQLAHRAPSRRCASTKNRPSSIGRPSSLGVSYVLTHPSAQVSLIS